MKKIIFTLFLLQSIIAFTQSADMNMQKYWYLRWRLKNYFMVIGPNYGEGVPLGIRNWMNDCVSTGDAPNTLATYICVLCTEIKLLKSKGMDYSETKRELYYALYAINRWDDCESQYPWRTSDGLWFDNAPYPSSAIGDYVPSPGNLNGACLRADTPNDFVSKNYESLHNNLNENFLNNEHGINPGNPKTLGDPWGMWDEGLNPQFNIDGMTEYGFKETPEYLSDNDNVYNSAIERVRASSMLSQDHISSLFMAFAVVVKTLDENENFNGIAFQDGESSFVKEAQNITRRIYSYMSISDFRLKLVNGHDIISDWGGLAYVNSVGFSQAAAMITQDEEIINNIPLGGLYWQTACATVSSLSDDPSSSAWIMMKLLSVGDYFSIFSTPPHLLSTQEVQDKIFIRSENKGWEAYYPLIHSYLHDIPYVTNKTKIEEDLNSMPCAGNFKIKNQDGTSFSSFPWSSPNKYHSSIDENQFGGHFDGVFTGLEYMFLMNLYMIQNPNYMGDYRYMKFGGKVADYYPWSDGISTFGASAPLVSNGLALVSPEYIYSLQPLLVDTKIYNGTYTINVLEGLNGFSQTQANLKGNLTVRSVGSVTTGTVYMDPGVSYFEIQSDPYECNDYGTGYEYKPNNKPTEHNQNLSPILKDSIDVLNSISFAEISVFPNPTKGLITVNKKKHKLSKIVVLDVFGKVVYETSSIFDCTIIDLREYSSGMYVVVCSTNEGEKKFKVFKE